MAVTDLVILALAPVGVVLWFMWFMNWRWRKHVWADIELNEGKSPVKRFKPDADGVLHTRWGDYFTHASAFTLRRGRPLFRYRQGDPFPIRYDKKKVMSDNPKHKVIEIANAERVVIPATTLAVFLKQKTYEQIYSSKFGMLFLLFIAVVVIGMMVIGLYLR